LTGGGGRKRCGRKKKTIGKPSHLPRTGQKGCPAPEKKDIWRLKFTLDRARGSKIPEEKGATESPAGKEEA